MILDYDLNQLKNICNDFYNVTGIRLGVLNDSLQYIYSSTLNKSTYCGFIQTTENGFLQCFSSDTSLLEECKKTRATATHICHAGLMDIAIPIIHLDTIIGYIILGQIKKDDKYPHLINACPLGSEKKEKLENYYSNIPLFDDDKIKSIINIASMLGKYILLEKIITLRAYDDVSKIIDFIDNNLEKRLPISYLSRSLHISKSSLYSIFHSRFNCTISEYINKKRIEKSLSLLQTSSMSLEEIAEKTGFSSGAYFSRIFKCHKGISPQKYKKQNFHFSAN